MIPCQNIPDKPYRFVLIGAIMCVVYVTLSTFVRRLKYI